MSLCSSQITARLSDPAGLLKRHISYWHLDQRGLPPPKQALRCICRRQLRDELVKSKRNNEIDLSSPFPSLYQPLWQHQIDHGDAIDVESREKCACSLFHLQTIDYGPGVPPLKLLAK